MTDKLPLHSPDIVCENIELIAPLFSNCITETANGKPLTLTYTQTAIIWKY